MTVSQHEIHTLRLDFETELFESAIPFWETHSPDWTHGGYFNHLDRDGTVYDPTKNVWLQARQVWMFSKLYTTVEQRPEWLDLAKLGIDFLRDYAVTNEGRVYFALTAEGKPIYLQRKIFSECFYAMALAEYARASGNASFEREAAEMFAIIWDMVMHPEKAGRPILEGTPKMNMLAVPMIVLNLVEEIAGDKFAPYSREVEYCIAAIQQHFVNETMYENIGPDGELMLDMAAGRLFTPGHAIEAGWFLLHWALRLADTNLRALASAIIRQSYQKGWDTMHGGLFYFLDAGGFSPVQLEWNMKLWWPHCEALYAYLRLYALEARHADWETFIQTKDYAFAHFSDPEFGEWFGYLNQRGERTHRFKGSAYKGCFHVPRSLWMCWELLSELEQASVLSARSTLPGTGA